MVHRRLSFRSRKGRRQADLIVLTQPSADCPLCRAFMQDLLSSKPFNALSGHFHAVLLVANSDPNSLFNIIRLAFDGNEIPGVYLSEWVEKAKAARCCSNELLSRPPAGSPENSSHSWALSLSRLSPLEVTPGLSLDRASAGRSRHSTCAASGNGAACTLSKLAWSWKSSGPETTLRRPLDARLPG